MAIGLVALFLLGAVVAGPVLVAPASAHASASSSSGQSAVTHAPAVAVPAAAPSPAATSTVSVTINSVFGAKTAIPTTVNFTVAVTNAEINNLTTQISWAVTDTVTSTVCTSGSYSSLVSGTNSTSSTYLGALNLTDFSTAQLTCNDIASHVDQLSIYVVVNGTASNGTVAQNWGNVTTTFTLPTTIGASITTAVPATMHLPQPVTINVTVTNATISVANLTVDWALMNSTGLGVCASGSLTVTNTSALTEAVSGNLTAADFVGANMAPGCANIYQESLVLAFTATINGTGNVTTPTGNFAMNVTSTTTIVIVPTSVQVAILPNTVLPIYSVLANGAAIPISFQIQVASATISTSNVSLWLNLTSPVTGTVCTTVNLDSLIYNTTEPWGNYTYPLVESSQISPAGLAACTSVLSSQVLVIIGASVNGTAAPYLGTVVESDTNATSTTQPTGLVFNLPTASLNFATTSTPFTYNLSAAFSGQYVGRVSLTIYSPGTTNIVFTANFASVPYSTWYQPKAGNYPYTLQAFAPYANQSTSGLLVLTATIPVYTNSTTWVNNTIFGGLSPAVGGTILLLVGLIVGMIVALVVGRAMFGARPAPTPPQAWEGKGGPAAPNTCSVCGKSFGTPEELAAHGKSEHGLQ